MSDRTSDLQNEILMKEAEIALLKTRLAEPTGGSDPKALDEALKAIKDLLDAIRKGQEEAFYNSTIGRNYSCRVDYTSQDRELVEVGGAS